MTDNYLGEIRLFPINYAPEGWHVCDGTIMQIQGNQALYSLIGKTYGGDGKTTFALPDLRGRVPVDASITNPTNYSIGMNGGAETVALTVQQMPAHNHEFQVYNGPDSAPEPNDILAIPANTISGAQINTYNTSNATTQTLNAASIENAGTSQGHNNMQPFLTLNFCIAVQGIYPPRP